MDYITILEYIGVFAFAVSGAIVAIEEEFDIFGIYIISIITAMGGGVLRDIITNRKPQIFKHDIYCVAGVKGVTILWFIHPILGMEISQLITLIIIVVIRMISYYKNIDLPVVCKQK